MNYSYKELKPAVHEVRERIDLSDVLSLLLRNLKLIIGAILLMFALAVALILIMPKKYEASALVLIDPRQIDFLADKAATDARLLTTDTLVVDSEVEIINSRALLRRAAERAGIFSDPEYSKSSILRDITRPLFSWLSSPSPENGKESTILSAFARNVTVERVGPTYVLQISYESESAVRAAEVVNIITEEYLADGVRAQGEYSKKSSSWLKQRLTELQGEVIAADRAVEVYKMENDLVSTQSGGLVTEQQVAEISSRLVAAQADVAQAQARLDSADTSLRSGNFATLSGGSGAEVFSKLLGDRMLLQQEAAKIEAAYGKTHLGYRKIMESMTEIDRQIRGELARISNGYEADLRAARQTEEGLRASLAALKKAALEGSTKEVKLRELEQQAEASKAIYQSMLEALNRTLQQQSLPMVTARVIQAADPPPKWSKPNWKLILALSLLLGAGCGIGAAFFIEGLRSTVYSSREIEEITGRPSLGIIPFLPTVHRKKSLLSRIPGWAAAEDPPQLTLVDDSAIAIDRLEVFHDILNDEGSVALDTLRTMEATVRQRGRRNAASGAAVIALGSALAGEGKSTVSLLFALHLASTGARVLLIDYDFRRAGLTKRLLPGRTIISRPLPKPGQFTSGSISTSITMFYDVTTGLVFLPAPGRSEASKDISRVIAEGSDQKIESLRTCFDFIVLDLPPLFHLPQGPMLAGSIDAFFMVVEWGKPNIRVLERSLRHIPEIGKRMAGSIISKVNTKRFIGFEKFEYY